jgi:hypothetical protein
VRLRQHLADMAQLKRAVTDLTEQKVVCKPMGKFAELNFYFKRIFKFEFSIQLYYNDFDVMKKKFTL